MTGGARVITVDRGQPRWDMVDLESQLPADHRARVVWAFVETLDLSEFYAAVKAREGGPGQDRSDPRVVLALWLYATLEGIGSARALDRLCKYHTVYRWLCGGVPVDHNLLSEFRRAHGDKLDRLLTRSLASLVSEQLVALDEVTIDGTKLRANAGRGSLAGRARLARLEHAVGERVARLRAELESDPAASERRVKERQLRGAAERARRIARAQAKLKRLEEESAARAKTHAKAEAAKAAPRVSVSDIEARPMRFADGATRPGWNLQVATANGFVLAVEPTDRRNDTGLAQGLVAQVVTRCGLAPRRLLADTRSIVRDDIKRFAALYPEMTVFSPPPADKPDTTAGSRRKRERQRAREAASLQAWRQRMAGAEGQDTYRRRKHIERTHAHMKNRGLARLLLRGIEKVRIVSLLHALAHNLWRAHILRTARA